MESNDINSNSTKPPLGLCPRDIREEQRVEEICEAIIRYKKAKKLVPWDWLKELADLVSPHLNL